MKTPGQFCVEINISLLGGLYRLMLFAPWRQTLAESNRTWRNPSVTAWLSVLVLGFTSVMWFITFTFSISARLTSIKKIGHDDPNNTLGLRPGFTLIYASVTTSSSSIHIKVAPTIDSGFGYCESISYSLLM